MNFSKAISRVLRHDAVTLGIYMRPDGFIQLADLMAVDYVARFNASMEDLYDHVENSDRKRFELHILDGHLVIRALYAHTIKAVDESLTGHKEDKVDKWHPRNKRGDW